MPGLMAMGSSTGTDWGAGRGCSRKWPTAKHHARETLLEDLGEDLLLTILKGAAPSARELCRYAGVNRMWKQICYSKCLWQKLSIDRGSMREGLESVANRCVALQELHIEDPLCELHILHPIIVACGSTLKKVSIDCDKDRTSRNEASVCSILWIISLYCKGVESIALVSDGREGTLGFLENKAMWYLTSGFRDIRSFTCFCHNAITKQSVYLMVIAWRELASLRIHCGSLQMEDLMALKKCYTLRQLELVGGKAGLVVPQPWGTVMHKDLEVVTFAKSCCSSHDVVTLARLCPNLQTVIVKFWACPWETTLQRRERMEGLKSLQERLRGRMLELQLDFEVQGQKEVS